MSLAQIECPFCKKKFFRNMNESLLPRSKSHICERCIDRGLEERQYKEPEPEEELKDRFFNPSQRKTSDAEIQELKDLINDEYLLEKGRQPTESEMRMELEKWNWLAKK
jgi:hypothetical protein